MLQSNQTLKKTKLKFENLPGIFFLILGMLASSSILAEPVSLESPALSSPASSEPDITIPPPSRIYEEVLVTGGKNAIAELSGAASFVDETAIQEFATSDLTALLGRVPGVYIRQEDGYGLRPNIGIRGTSSERSTKITLMEDGILIGPAPYAAPAAYYTPSVSRMHAVEVFKGPAAIRYGPHTVGGAINFVTRPIAETREGELNLMAGQNDTRQYRGYYSSELGNIGYSIDAMNHSTGGFKQLDFGGDTGFAKNDINGRMRWRSSTTAPVYQEFEMKLGYADEDSNETYLGLAERDFVDSPNRRYAASQLDQFDSDHQQLHLFHSMDFNNGWALFSKGYYNRFARSWNKFDGIIGGNDVLTILENPLLFEQEYQLITGTANSNPLSRLRLDLTENQREYTSSGLEFNISRSQSVGQWQHEIQGGVLLHRDYVERNHILRGYFMNNSVLVFDGDATRPPKALNRGEAEAVAFYLKDEMRISRWIFNVGLRYESIDTVHTDKLPAQPTENQARQTAFMPGVGAVYALNDQFSLLVGINKAFSPKSAVTQSDADSEESMNLEYGFRYQRSAFSMESIGFYSDYSNLLGRCRIVDTSCEGDVNGGEVNISGLELSAQQVVTFDGGLELPIIFAYTLTRAEFKSSFDSDFAQWGRVDRGDELPYIPESQGRLQVGVRSANWSSDLALRYIDEMREIAGSGDFVAGEYLEALMTVDWSSEYRFENGLSVKLVVENLADKQQIVSRRPLAARPNHPRMARLGIAYRF